MISPKTKKLKIVVFGSGYLGFEICQKFKNLDFDVLIASRLKKQYIKKKEGIIYKTYKNDFKKILKNKDVVICANGPISDFDSFNNIKNEKIIKNYKSLIKKIFRESLKQNIKKFIYLSSIHSLLKKNKYNDTKMYYYSMSKVIIEKEIIKLSKGKKIDIKILRLTNIFGYSSKKKFVKSKSIINNFIDQTRAHNYIKIFSKTDFKRIFLPISIFLNYIVFFVESDNKTKIFNIGNKIYYFSIFEIFKIIKKIVFDKKRKKIKVYKNFLINNKESKIKKFKYFKTSKIKNHKIEFYNQLKKMI